MERVGDLLNRGCEVGLMVVLSAMAIAVFLQVIFRYLIQFPLFWTEEFARYCLVWASLIGASVALRRGEHIAVTFFVDLFPVRVRAFMAMIARISVGIMLTVVLWGGIKLVIVTSTQLSPALRLPMAVPYLALPVCSAIMLFHVITSIVSREG